MHAGERYSLSGHFLIGTADYRSACILPSAHCLNPHLGPGALNGLGWHDATGISPQVLDAWERNNRWEHGRKVATDRRGWSH